MGRVELPADFWARPEVTSALARRDIGVLLDLTLKQARLSQQKLGMLTGLSQTQISHYISGEHKPGLDVIRRIADGVNMPAAARASLGLAAADLDVQDRPGEVPLHRILDLAEYIGRTGDTSQIATWRELTSHGRSTEPWDRLGDVITAHSSAEMTAPERIPVRTRGFYLVTAKLPARLVTRALTRHAHEITLLLDAVDKPEQRRQLIVTGGESAYLAACCNVDLGDYCGAMRQLDTMEAAAGEVGDPPLAAMALDGQSHFQAAQRHHARALDLIGQALDACPADMSPGTIAYLWLRIAEEHVYLRQMSKAARAWQQAEDQYKLTDLAADRNWTGMWVSRDCWESVRAVIYSATGRPKDSAEAAERVAFRLAAADGKTDAVALVNAALAQANVGLVKEAARTGAQALNAIRAAETSVCLARLSIVADIVGSHTDRSPKIGEFLRDFTRTQQALTAS